MSSPARKGILRGGAITLLTQFILFFVSFAASIVLARALGPAGRGSYALMLLIAVVLGKVGSLGIEVSNVYYVSKRPDLLPVLSVNALFISGVVGGGLILLVGILSAIPPVYRYLSSNGIGLSLLYLTIATVPLMLLTTYFLGILQGQERIIHYNMATLSSSVFQLLLLILLLLVLKWDLGGSVLAYVAATTLGVGISAVFMRQHLRFPLRPSMSALRLSSGYAWKAYIANLVQFLNYRLDQFLTAFFLGPAALGIYAVAVTISERLWMVPQSMATVLFPRVSMSSSQEANSLTPRMARNMLFLLTIVSLGLGFAGRILISFFFGSEFDGAAIPLLWLLPGVVALGYGKILMSDLLGRGMPKVGMITSSISLILTIILDIALIPRLGIAGAAIASSTAYIISTLVIFIAFIQATQIPMRQLILMDTADFRLYIDVFRMVLQRIRSSLPLAFT